MEVDPGYKCVENLRAGNQGCTMEIRDFISNNSFDKKKLET